MKTTNASPQPKMTFDIAVENTKRKCAIHNELVEALEQELSDLDEKLQFERITYLKDLIRRAKGE
jgi:hypothetical protein